MRFRSPSTVSASLWRLARGVVLVVVAAAGVLTTAGAVHAASVFNPVVNVGNGKCLDVRAEDGYYNPGARVQQYHCTGAQEQQWRLLLVTSPDGSFPSYEIVSQRSGLCLGRSANAFDGLQVIQMACAGANVVWFPISTGNGYNLRNIFDYRCLDVSGNSSADHAKVQMWTCNGTAAQNWRITFP